MAEVDRRWLKFSSGNLSGIRLFMTEAYSENYENGDTDFEMMKSIEDSKPSGKTIFDVGAFIGASSLVFSKMVGDGGSVIAFEPNPYNLKRMNKNLEGNPILGRRVKTFTFALSDSNDNTSMFLSENVDCGPSSTSRINNSHSTIRNEDLPEGFMNVDIENKKLDDFIKSTELKPDIIKVDIEGAEHLLLAGALNTLEKYHPTLYIEMHSEYCAIRCYEILRDLGYTLTIIREENDNRVMVRAQFDPSTNKTNMPTDIRGYFLQLQNTQALLLKQIEKTSSFEGRVLAKKENELNNLKNNLDSLRNETELMKNKLEEICDSNSWKITRPVRVIVQAIKSVRSK